MEIFQSINKVMEEIGAIEKSKSCTEGVKFSYRGIDDIMNALQPCLIKHGVFIVPEVLSRIDSTRKNSSNNKDSFVVVLRIKYTFYSSKDGTFVSCVVEGEAKDSGDKATNKAMATAFKYACLQVFCIPTEEMHDPDSNAEPTREYSVDEKISLNKKQIHQLIKQHNIEFSPEIPSNQWTLEQSEHYLSVVTKQVQEVQNG